MHEEYKKTLTGSQRSIFEELEHELTEQIKDTENELRALALFSYCPKKDGTSKQNFSLNFGLVQPWGESFRTKRWNGSVETNRYVDVWLDRDCNHRPTAVNFNFRPYYDDGKGTDPKPEGCKCDFKYFQSNVYFRWDGFAKWAGFDPEKEPEKLECAPFIFRVINEFYAGKQRERLEGYRKELEELPKWFTKACDMAKRMRELVKSTQHLTTVHSFMYSNFEAKQVPYLNND